MLVDNSSLDQTERLGLSALADMLVNGDDTLMGLRDHPNKGVSEAAMVRKALNLVRHWPHKRLFKLSGRYELTDAFRVERFSASRFSFLLGDGVYSTVLYSVPQAEEALFDDVLSRVIETAGALDGIERLMRDLIPDDRVALVPQLGIQRFRRCRWDYAQCVKNPMSKFQIDAGAMRQSEHSCRFRRSISGDLA